MNALPLAVEWGGASRLPITLAVLLPLALFGLVVYFAVRQTIHLALLFLVVFAVVLGYHYGYLPPRGA